MIEIFGFSEMFLGLHCAFAVLVAGIVMISRSDFKKADGCAVVGVLTVILGFCAVFVIGAVLLAVALAQNM
jgi:hypothetical protein